MTKKTTKKKKRKKRRGERERGPHLEIPTRGPTKVTAGGSGERAVDRSDNFLSSPSPRAAGARFAPSSSAVTAATDTLTEANGGWPVVFSPLSRLVSSRQSDIARGFTRASHRSRSHFAPPFGRRILHVVLPRLVFIIYSLFSLPEKGCDLDFKPKVSISSRSLHVSILPPSFFLAIATN